MRARRRSHSGRRPAGPMAVAVVALYSYPLQEDVSGYPVVASARSSPSELRPRRRRPGDTIPGWVANWPSSPTALCCTSETCRGRMRASEVTRGAGVIVQKGARPCCAERRRRRRRAATTTTVPRHFGIENIQLSLNILASLPRTTRSSTKVLTNRINTVAGHTAFRKRGYILESVVTAHDRYFHSVRKKNKQGVTLKLNYEKAY